MRWEIDKHFNEPVDMVSLDAEIEADSTMLVESFGEDDTLIDGVVEHAWADDAVRILKKTLSEREQRVVRRRLAEVKYQEIGEELGVTAMRAHQLASRSARKLRKQHPALFSTHPTPGGPEIPTREPKPLHGPPPWTRVGEPTDPPQPTEPEPAIYPPLNQGEARYEVPRQQPPPPDFPPPFNPHAARYKVPKEAPAEAKSTYPPLNRDAARYEVPKGPRK